jgi:hypothetical protein
MESRCSLYIVSSPYSWIYYTWFYQNIVKIDKNKNKFENQKFLIPTYAFHSSVAVEKLSVTHIIVSVFKSL